MILQALTEYYDRKGDLPLPGFEQKEIPFIIVLDEKGNCVNIEITYEGDGKKKKAKKFLVPQAVKKTVNIASNILWENPEYALGIQTDKKSKDKSDNSKELQKIKDRHNAFIQRINELGDIPELTPLKNFLNSPTKIEQLKKFNDAFKMICNEDGYVTFKIAGKNEILLENKQIKDRILELSLKDNAKKYICLISGEKMPIERLHPAIKGLKGAQSSGANIISFNAPAFQSYGKEQGLNAPVSKTAAFKYTTALNHLLSKDSQQKLSLVDTTIVFWSEKDSAFEKEFYDFFGETKDDPDKHTKAVASLFSSPQTGAFYEEEMKTRFYVLGLAPNASRISIRFWIVDSIAGMSEKIKTHFQDLRISHKTSEKDYLSIYQLLKSLAVKGKEESIPPNLAGEFLRTILEGLPYPETLLQLAIRRNRSEQNVNYQRAALIKAYLNRKIRFDKKQTTEELKMSLDKENKNIGYRLGRLFAVLVKNQEDANNATTIKDSYYGSASSTPRVAFSTLMRLSRHHLSKLQKENPGLYVAREKLIGEIMSEIKDFPAHLSIENQGRFAIGYYHQMEDFFNKNITQNEEEN